jgi:subtilisin family serine protease
VGVLGLSIVSAAGAASNPVVVPDGALDGFTPVVAPLGLSSKPTTVIVQLPGNPITVADANASAPLSDADKKAIRAQLKAAQAPVAQQIEALGGTVLATYQAAYNGIKVQIAGDKAAQLRSIPGVKGVWPVRTYKPDNVHGVPFIGAPLAWDPTGGNFHGEGIKIADIDTGIDYTHADFGGSGNPADYQAALTADTLPAPANWFGPNAPKV